MKWTRNEEDILYAGLKSLGLDIDDDIVNKLNTYAREILLWNRTHGLVNLSEAKELAGRHILDSLAALSYMGSPETLADAGSGAGFPGIPLAICLPETRVFLIEKMGRRCDFLRNALAVTGLSKRVEVVQESLEKAGIFGPFEAVTLRAFAPLPRVLDQLFEITAPGGRIFAYKGKKESIREELGMEDSVKNDLRVVELKVPGLNAERNLVILEKK